jgi:bacteriocin-like protein
MDNSKVDLGKNDRRVDGLSNPVRTELNNEELSNVSGGGVSLYSACVTGKHIKAGTITCR